MTLWRRRIRYTYTPRAASQELVSVVSQRRGTRHAHMSGSRAHTCKTAYRAQQQSNASVNAFRARTPTHP